MRRFLATRIGGDRGLALPLVIGVSALLLILVSVSVSYSVGGLRQSKNTQDWSGALAAAYAGIEEYQSRIADDSTYMQYGNSASTFSTGSTLSMPNPSNPAFGLGQTGSWAAVAGSDGTAQFRYEVNTAQYAATGTIRLRSTGRVGDDTRSIVADLRQEGFIDFLYFTDYEIQDPAISGDATTCVKYAWQGRPSGCSEIAFGSNDVLRGPVHSNDTLRICDSTFEGTVTTGYKPASGIKYAAKDSNGSSCGGQVFQLVGYPAYSPVVGMPATNSQLKRETRSDLTTNGVPRPGCLYTGPTRITLNAAGTITVRSPWTKKTRIAGDPATSGTTPSACGTVGTGTGQLGSTAGATFTMPENNVIYVQSVPAVTTDPNYWASTAKPTGLTCTGASGGTTVGNGIGYPMANEKAPADSGSLASYGCRNGDVFVSGTVDGHQTIAAENYVYVVDNIYYEDAQDDVLGLVGNNAVWVWNPVNSSNVSLLNNNGRRIDSTILSVAHTFQVQNYTKGGNRGTLTVNGSIAQKFRGVVRNGSNGYAKDYKYDQRLRYMAPPKFLSPVTTTYGVNVWVEIEPVFKADGTYK